MMKKFPILTKRVVDVLRSTVNSPPKADIDEPLKSEHFTYCKTVCHGFPHSPTSIAYDPVQHLLAIGTKNGSIRLYGQPGVECSLRHSYERAVIQLIFLINQGALLSVCDDDSITLWTLKKKVPEIIHSLKFQKERITFIHTPFESSWLYIGTDRGNVHMANLETFMVSGYVINWNKAIELSRKTHPGPVVHLSDCPADQNKLLIGFESCTAVLWDLRAKTAEARFNYTEALRSISWHHEGRQFICSHTDGSITTWNIKSPAKPASIFIPHAKQKEHGKPDPCRPISKLEWKTVRTGEPYILFSGGMPCDKSGKAPSITIINGKSTTVLEMEYYIVDFITVCATPWNNDFQDPSAVIVLLQNDLVMVDLTSPGYPCFENPYPMDIHESHVTACQYYANCPPDLIPAYYSVGCKQTKRTGFSSKEWPVSGGECGKVTCSYPEIVITGHADGSVKFWDASGVNLQILYKVKTSKIFDRKKIQSTSNSDVGDEDPFAIQLIYLCPESRLLAVAGAAHVILLKYSKQETHTEIPCLDVSIVYEVNDEPDSPEMEFPPLTPIKPNMGYAKQKSTNFGSHDVKEVFTSVKVKSGARKFSAGYQPELVGLLTWTEDEVPGNVTSLVVNSSYGLMSFGNENGLAVLDFVQKTCLLNLGTPDLYGSMDPYQRIPRSPKNKKSESQSTQNLEDCKSPTADQMNGMCNIPTNVKQKTRQPPPELKRTRSQDKNDGIAFSRSQSSSMSSLDNIGQEAVQCLQFADSYTRKTDSFTCPCLWVGTSLGSVLVIVLSLPPLGEQRLCQPVIVSPSGTIFRMKGSILNMSFLDCTGALIPNQSEQWRDQKTDKKSTNRQISSTNNNKPRISPTTSTEMCDRQYTIISSDKGAMVMSLPSQTCAYKVKFIESSFATTADVIAMRDSVCLACYLSNGHLQVYSLPSLKLLFDVQCVQSTDIRIARTFTFTNNGHAMYMCSPSEVQKLSFSHEITMGVYETLANPYNAEYEIPEGPKPSFFSKIFIGAASNLDRQELFGETNAGKASKGLYTCKTTMEQLNGQTLTAGQAAQRARLGLIERGEKLGTLEDKTAQMTDQAKAYRDNAHALMARYRDKKWYQI